MDAFNLAQLTKQMVVKGVAQEQKGAYAVAQDAVRETLGTYLCGMIPDNPEVRQGVREVARGAMTGMLLCDLPMAESALAVLRGVAEVSLGLPHDPTALLTGSIEGIAEMRLLLSIEALGVIETAIEREYEGSGEVFRKCLELKGSRDEFLARRAQT